MGSMSMRRRGFGFAIGTVVGAAGGVGATSALSQCPASEAEVARLTTIETAAKDFSEDRLTLDEFRAIVGSHTPAE